MAPSGRRSFRAESARDDHGDANGFRLEFAFEGVPRECTEIPRYLQESTGLARTSVRNTHRKAQRMQRLVFERLRRQVRVRWV